MGVYDDVALRAQENFEFRSAKKHFRLATWHIISFAFVLLAVDLHAIAFPLSYTDGGKRSSPLAGRRGRRRWR